MRAINVSHTFTTRGIIGETEEIAKHDFILTPGRYVGIEEQEDDGEPFEEKMERLTSELAEMFKRSHELEAEIRERLRTVGFDIAKLT